MSLVTRICGRNSARVAYQVDDMVASARRQKQRDRSLLKYDSPRRSVVPEQSASE